MWQKADAAKLSEEEMEPWLISLLLKPVAGILILVVFFGLARLFAVFIWWVLPAGRIKNELFLRWRDDGAAVVARPGQRDLKDAPVLFWKEGKKPPGL